MPRLDSDLSFEREVYGILTKGLSVEAGSLLGFESAPEDSRGSSSERSLEDNHFQRLAENFKEIFSPPSKL